MEEDLKIHDDSLIIYIMFLVLPPSPALPPRGQGVKLFPLGGNGKEGN
jgi:hypothetical protein